jgi:HlyD family secretion protein
MEQPGKTESHRHWWLLSVGVALVLVAAVFFTLARGFWGQKSNGASAASAQEIRVEVIRPKRGLIERTTGQACNAYAFDIANLYAEVPGYLDKQPVDIGSKVKKGDLLVEIAVPELVEQEKQKAASVKQAEANVKLSRAKKLSADADLASARAAVKQAEADLKTARAMLALRTQQLTRYRNLYAEKAIERELVDEFEEQKHAAEAKVYATTAAISSAEAQVEAAKAKVAQAVAGIENSQTLVYVAQAELGKAQAMVNFSTLRAPYGGVITVRNFNVGDFVRAATEGGEQIPLLTLQKMDVMRVVVSIPDRDAPLAHAGKDTIIRFDALPGRTYKFPVARVAHSENQETKTMRLEVDLPNSNKTILQALKEGHLIDPALSVKTPTADHPIPKILQGMYGLATIILQKEPNALTVPSSCLVGKTQNGEGELFVVRDGKLQEVHVKIGIDNGVRVQILETPEIRDLFNQNADVVLNPSGEMIEGESVTPVLVDSNP